MAIVEPRQTHIPDRLLIALLHAGVAPQALHEQYGGPVSPDLAVEVISTGHTRIMKSSTLGLSR
jgi:hypothetical protein